MSPAPRGSGSGSRRRPTAKKTAPRNRSGDGPSQIDRLEDLHDKLAEGIERIQTSEGWQQLLRASSRLHHYSANNIMLLLMQKEDVSAVAGFRTWQAEGRQVRKGQKALYILAPLKQRLDVEDKETGETQKVTKLRGFKAAAVFDISQTDGPDLPPPMKLTGEAPPALWDGMVAVLQDKGYRVERTQIPGGAKGDTGPDGVVRIDTRGTPMEQLAVLAHELSHVAHGHIEEIEEYRAHQDRFEVEAESSAFIVLEGLGLDLGDWSAQYSAEWAAKNPELVQETAAKVVKVGNELLDALLPDLGLGVEREEIGEGIEVPFDRPVIEP